ncbi:hypothetical protein N2601_08705 [Rhizobium sp. CB3060]|uniref:hypothetical protein n=1 Tax=Rhizobium sp. CB3060 TaxID=3138255 RepID=UPI0021A2D4A1|nr:hypothetical protein [Rhizobium tropici]UWU23009.1 hypothetical protein N2601_08705 [Rhizobium tropici]
MIMLSRNAPYPFPFHAKDGATANFLTLSGHTLQITMANAARSEIMSVRNDPVKAGFIHDGSLILWVFVIGPLIFDCPFDARLIRPNIRDLPNIENDRQRLGIDIHLVDTATTMLKAIRFITLSPSLTQHFLTAAQDQLADPRNMSAYLAKYNRVPITGMPHLANVEPCGR